MGPPFHDWGDYYLVSIHMLQHLVLMLVVAPLLLKGIPAWFFNPITRRPVLDRIGRFLTHPAVSFVIGNVIMVLWHLPALYDAALEEPALHAVQHNALMSPTMPCVNAWTSRITSSGTSSSAQSQPAPRRHAQM